MNKMMISAVMVMAAWIALGGELRFKDAEIVLPEKPFATAKIAAGELQYHLRKMTGGFFPIVSKRTSRFATAIYVGDQPAAAKVSLSLKQVKPDGFLRSVKGRDIYILGDDDPKKPKGPVTVFYFETKHRGTLHGVYDFLEELGVRWPAPGKHYEYIPAREEIVISDAEKNEAPVFSQRNMTRIHNFMKYNDAKVYADEAADATWWALRMRASWIRGIAEEPEMKKVLFDPAAAPENVWKDDTIELFIENQGRVRQIIFSASGKYSSRMVPEDQWGSVPGLVHSVHNHTKARRLEIALPLPQGKGGSFRMNLTRSRKLTTRYRESSTWSESANRGWTDPSGYAAVMIK